jgi:hypothetical protein
VRLRLPDGAEQVDIELLRTAEWVRENRAAVGATLWLDLPHVGVRGAALVTEVMAGPTPTEGEGGLVTGAFRHSRRWVFDLWVEGEDKAIGVTPTHPIWSEDRQAWVPAGELRIGERLQASDGTTPRVVSLTLRAAPEPVYNIEVDGDHCYRVGRQGLLAHNASPGCPIQASFTHRGRKKVQVGWTKAVDRHIGNSPGELYLSTGISGTVIATGADRTNLYTPGWYMDFRKSPASPYSPDDTEWRKGHLIGSQFEGPREFYNFFPQYDQMNNVSFKACEFKIAKAIEIAKFAGCFPCVEMEVTPIYTTDQVVPSHVRLVAKGHGGADVNLDVTIPNVKHPVAPPTQCQ